MNAAEEGRALRIAVVAGEASGDSLGAGLIREIKARRPGSVFTGVGGPEMAAAGCEILFDMERIGVIGLDGLLKKLPGIFRIRRSLLARFCAERPDVFVGIDAPDFNLALARKLKRRGLTCAHYVSPTVWAWRGYRIRKIRNSTDHMLALFPFEAEFYRKQNVPVTCVGHPIADEISAPDRARARRELGLDDGLVIALLPGSRRGEMRRHGRVFLEAARRILAAHPRARFVLPFAGASVAEEFRRITRGLRGAGDLPLRAFDGGARLALEACDLAVLASGTAALEAALLRRAHIVVYKLPWFSYWLMRKLVRVEYYSMPNQLLPAPMIPELIQRRATAANIAAEVDALLADARRVSHLGECFAAMHRELKRGANARAADAVLALAA
ncbi:MAG: lipid-A-disaccharide synthase [Gammaproteobacteria bacterium]|nr:lipid-A-disaccharide synthase [Gammaproteobacteria bacterium]